MVFACSKAGSARGTGHANGHVQLCPPRALEERYSSLEAERDSNTRFQLSRLARKGMGRVVWEDGPEHPSESKLF
jgi:hypothetical protein